MGFSLEYGFFSSWLGFFEFWGVEIETDLPGLVFGGEDPSPTARIVGSAGFGLVSIGSSRWVGSRIGLDRPSHEISLLPWFRARLA